MKRWYVVQVYAGYEEAVKAEILKRIQEEKLEDFFGEILIPSAKFKGFFSLQNLQTDEQLFPGYILIEMEASQQTIRIVSKVYRVIRFLGGAQPVPLTKQEIERIMGQIKGEVQVVATKHEFETGKEVEIKEGPFAGFVGIIDKIDQDAEKLTVMVSIFGRLTPVELSFDQVKH